MAKSINSYGAYVAWQLAAVGMAYQNGGSVEIRRK